MRFASYSLYDLQSWQPYRTRLRTPPTICRRQNGQQPLPACDMRHATCDTRYEFFAGHGGRSQFFRNTAPLPVAFLQPKHSTRGQ